jgi:hypothetical protein
MGFSSGKASPFIVDPAQTNSLLAWNYDPSSAGTSKTPAAAVIHLAKIPIPRSITITNLLVQCVAAGTSYTNTQFGLYSSAGVLLTQTPVYASAGTNFFVATGALAAPLDIAQPISGSPTAFVWAAIHMGTNSATAVILAANAGSAATANVGVGVSAARFGFYTGHATNTLQTIGNLTPASIGVSGNANQTPFFGVT